ncbi:hypothetical protein ACETU7_02720 [Rhodococcus sp. 3Y1]
MSRRPAHCPTLCPRSVPATLRRFERAARAENEVDGDGQFIGRCTDGMQWPGIGRARELADTWGTNYPVFGRAALGLLACASWPSTANSPCRIS